MAKRFTDTDKYKKPFMRGLQGAYKLLWDYLYHDCNHAGIWIVDFEIAQIYLGSDMLVNKSEAMKLFNDSETRIIEIDGGKKWFIPSFIAFQYGSLNETNKAHKSVLQILKTYNLQEESKGLTSPLEGAKTKDRVEEKYMDKGRMQLMSELKSSNGPFSEIEEISLSFWELFCGIMQELKINSTDLKKQKKSAWIEPVRLAIEKDGRSVEEFTEIWNYLKNEQAGKDGFMWKVNIRSGKKLREKFEALLLAARNPKNQSKIRNNLNSINDATNLLRGHYSNN